MYENEMVTLLAQYFTEPPFAAMVARGENWVKIKVPDGDTFQITVVREERDG